MADAADRGYQFVFLGWMLEGTSDKVWGYIKLNSGSYYNFWGRRGKTLRFKRHADSARQWNQYDLTDLSRKKLDKGYKKLTEAEMEVISPGFAEEFGSQFVMAKFSGAIMSDVTDDDSEQSFI